MEESVPARAKSRARRHLLYPRNKYELVPFSLSARTWASASSRYRERASMVVLQSLRSRRIMESARTMSSSSSRYAESMAHVQAGEVHVNCPSIMTVSSGKGHTTTLTPTMCRLSLACGTATMVVVARPLCLLDMRGTSIDKSSNAVVRGIGWAPCASSLNICARLHSLVLLHCQLGQCR